MKFKYKGDFEVSFTIFKILRKYNKNNLKLKIQDHGGLTLLSQNGDLTFKQKINKLNILISDPKDKEIVKKLNKYNPTKIKKIIKKTLENIKSGDIDEIYNYIKNNNLYNFGAKDEKDVLFKKIKIEIKKENIKLKGKNII